MTAQFGDRLFFEGQWRTLFSNPLETLFKAGFPRPYSILRHQGHVTANWRGYIASWDIRDDDLFLLDLCGALFAEVSTGAMAELFSPKGDVLPLCPWCRKPFEPEPMGRFRYSAPFFCPHCGSFQRWRTCPDCGFKSDFRAVFCARCGRSLGHWECEKCRGKTIDWMETRPPLPPPGFHCIRCGTKIPRDDKTASDGANGGLKPGIPPVKARWFTGTLQIPRGQCFEHRHMGYDSIHETDILFHVEEGHITQKETRNNLTPEFLDRLRALAEAGHIPEKLFKEAFEKSPYAVGEYTFSKTRSFRALRLPPIMLESKRKARCEPPRFEKADASKCSDAFFKEQPGEKERRDQAAWFFEMSKRRRGKGYTLEIADGRSVRITQLFQLKTYARLLVGFPTVASNRRLIQDLLTMVDKKIAGATRPHLIPPDADTYPGAPSDMEYTEKPYYAQRLPSVTCFAHLESGRPAVKAKAMLSCLTVVWFQEDFAFPIDRNVQRRISEIDWQRLAVDGDL